MVSFLIGLVGTVLSLIGWFGYHSLLLLSIGTGLYIVETLIEWKNLNRNAKTLDISIFIIGCVCSILFASNPWYVGGMLALAFYSALMSILGIGQYVQILMMLFKNRK